MKIKSLKKLVVLGFTTFSFASIGSLGGLNTVNAADVGVLECKSGSASWELRDDGELVLRGEGAVLSSLSFEGLRKKDVKSVVCDSIMSCEKRINLSETFSGWSNVEKVDLSKLSALSVVDANSMFSGCSKLKYVDIHNINLSDCKHVYDVTTADGVTSRVYSISMRDMFLHCDSLQEIEASKGYLGALPFTSTGYEWVDSTGKSLKNQNYSSSCETKVVQVESGTVRLSPIKYKISYHYTTYEKSDDGRYYYDSTLNKMVYDFNYESSGRELYYGLGHQDWDNNINPTSYTIEDEDIVIQKPSFCPEGYTLVYWTPEVIDTSKMTSYEVEAVFLPEEDVKVSEPPSALEPPVSTDTTEDNKGGDSANATEDTNDSGSTEKSTEVQSTENKTTEKSTEVQSSSSKSSVVKKAESKKVTINSTKNVKGKKIKVSLKKVKGYKYQIKVSTSKTFKKNVKTYNTSKTSYTIKKLKKGKTYYIKSRTYKTIDGEKVYGKWSKVKKVTIKK